MTIIAGQAVPISAKNVEAVEIKRQTGHHYERASVYQLTPKNYRVIEQSMGGDAPKEFIRADVFGQRKGQHPNTWPAYIAKVGHKWYPCESVTEHLLTRVGEVMGFRMARSCLAELDGQLRFLSRFFLQEDQTLTHGLQIIMRYLEDESEAFKEELTEKHREANHVMFQDIIAAIQAIFPEQKAKIIRSYVRMLAFDAIVGNHDRHFFNWGVITDLRGRRPPTFSPIFDSARGCFWNLHEDTIAVYAKDKNKVTRYVKRSDPLVGYEGESKLNHFQLIAKITTDYTELGSVLRSLHQPKRLPSLKQMLEREFSQLISVGRRTLIFDYLALRLGEYGKAVR